jgi:hypothetical protein
MALLLPFYILKIRKELKKKGTDSARKKALAAELKKDIALISKVLKKCKQNNYITKSDVALLLNGLCDMHLELYGKHEEFMEVDSMLKKLSVTRVGEAIREAVAETDAKAEKRGVIKTAKNMLKEKFDLAVIARITQLPEKEILALR